LDFAADESYSEEQESFAREVRAWLNEKIPDDLERPRDPRKMSREQWEKRRELGRKLGEKGWLYPGVPLKYGGGGLDAAHSVVVHREMADRGLSLPLYYDIGPTLAVPAILACGTEEQKQRLLPRIYRGEVVTWQLFTEPEAGTDEANQQTNALRHRREGDHFVVNGSKIFVGGLYEPPDQFLLLTRCDLEAPRHENLAMFVTPADLPGVTIQALGLFPSGNFSQACGPASVTGPGDKYSVFFDDVRIHESCLIGGEGGGWRAANATLTAEHGDRGSSPGTAGGVVARDLLLDKLLDRCRNDARVAARLRANPELLDRLVTIYSRAEIQRLWSLRNAWLPRSGRRVPYAGPQLLLYSKILGNELLTDIADILGPYALTDDAEWSLDEGFFELGQRGGLCTAPAGTPEALKIVISRALAIGRPPAGSR